MSYIILIILLIDVYVNLNTAKTVNYHGFKIREKLNSLIKKSN
jgi:hypothetical protein